MLEVILMVVFGLVVALFATQNTGGVTVVFGGSPIPDIPLYVVVIASLLVGLFVGLVIHTFGSISSFFTLRSKDSTIAGKDRTLTELDRRNRDLERENTKLKAEINTLSPSIKDKLLNR